MSNFNADDPRITAYLFDELEAPEKDDFESKLAQSRELQETVDQTRRTVGLLESAFRNEMAVTTSDLRPAGERLAAKTKARSMSSRGRWVFGIIAAILLIVGGIGLTQLQNQQTAQSDVNTNSRDESGRQVATKQTAGSQTTATTPSPEADFDSLIESVVESVGPDTWDEVGGEGSNEGFATNLSLVVSNDGEVEESTQEIPGDSVQLMVTPQIVIGESEEQRLGGDTGRGVHPAAPVDNYSTLESKLGNQRADSETGKADISSSNGSIAAVDELERLTDQRQKFSVVEFSVVESSIAPAVDSFRAARDESIQPTLLGLEPQPSTDPEIDPFEFGIAEGQGPGQGGDRFEPIYENDFVEVRNAPLSTFSIDVDTASYSKTRQFLMESNQLPRPDAVRIEELLNYFSYDYESPTTADPFRANVEVASCPWKPKHRLVRIGLKGKEFPKEERPSTNLVFLLDVSGSMDQPNKLPLLKRSMKLLTDQLDENDRVAVIVYAGAAGKVLESTTADKKTEILGALDRLHAGGSTNGGAGIHLAYQTAMDNFVKGGVNRVILCTDGDFNVGTTGTDELVRIAEEHAKTGVFLSVFGFGMGNHNDSMLEQISNKGNGNYGFIDTDREAKKAFVEQLTGTLVTIAKDVKIQIEFNPREVVAYRLIGYENRILAAQDFNDDGKDAGEIGAGHTVTALYEVVPTGVDSDINPAPVDDLKYQRKNEIVASEDASSGELLTLKLRYKQPDGDTSKLLTFPVTDEQRSFGQSSQDYRFAASVASFGMLLRNSKYRGEANWDSVLELAVEGSRDSNDSYRSEFIEMVKRAKSICGE